MTLVFPLYGIAGFGVAYRKEQSAVPPALLIGLTMGVFAMGYVHNGEGDITRYASYALSLSDVGLSDALSSSYRYADYPLASIWFWLIGQVGSPELLKFSIVFPQYAIASFVIIDYSKENDFTTRQLVAALLLLLLFNPLFNVMSAVRSTPALALLLLAVYLDLYKGVRTIWLLALYIAAVFLHSVAYAVVGLRLLFQLFRKTPLLCALFAALAIPAMPMLDVVLSPLSGILNVDLHGKLDFYSSWETGYAATVASSSFYQLLRGVHAAMGLLCMILLIVFLHGRHRVIMEQKEERLAQFAIAGIAFTLGILAFIQVPSYLRLSYFLYPLIICLIVHYAASHTENRTGFVRLSLVVLVVLCCILFYCYLKLFVSHMILKDFLKIVFLGVIGVIGN